MKRVVAGLLILSLTLLVAACIPMRDSMATVTVVNQTSERVYEYTMTDSSYPLTGGRWGAAGTSFESGHFPAPYRWLRLATTREDGQWVSDHTYTWEEVKRVGNSIVIASLTPIVPPSDVGVLVPKAFPPAAVPPVTFVNETRESLAFYTQVDGEEALRHLVSVAAGSSWDTPHPQAEPGKSTVAMFRSLRVMATREDGEWVFGRLLTLDELTQAKRRVVASSLTPVPPPYDVRVIPSQDAPQPKLRTPTGGSKP